MIHDKRGRIVAICRPAGGTGSTFVAVNLAAVLAEKQLKTALIDGDLQFGDTAVALDVNPPFTLKEYAERKDVNQVQNYCALHSSGIHLLAAPTRPEYADLVTPDLLGQAIERLASEMDFVLIDTPPVLNEANLLIMEKADDILLVTTPGMSVLKNTKLFIETMDGLGMKDKLRLIVNKSSLESVIKLKDIPELCKIEEIYELPMEEKYALLSFDQGIPVVKSHPKANFSKQLLQLANEFFIEEKADTTKNQKRWMKFFSYRKTEVKQ